MRLLHRLVDDLKAGWASLRHGTAQVATRALEETELVRYRLELRKVDQQLNELYTEVGEQAVDLFERGDTAERISGNMVVLGLVKQVRSLQDTRKRLLAEMGEVREDS